MSGSSTTAGSLGSSCTTDYVMIPRGGTSASPADTVTNYGNVTILSVYEVLYIFKYTHFLIMDKTSETYSTFLQGQCHSHKVLSQNRALIDYYILSVVS